MPVDDSTEGHTVLAVHERGLTTALSALRATPNFQLPKTKAVASLRPTFNL